jgi:hypothetical protein
LAAHWQTATMTHATVSSQVSQTLDRELNFTTQVTFNGEQADLFANALEFRVGQIFDLLGVFNTRCFANLASAGATDAENRGKTDFGVLMRRDVNAGNTGHGYSLLNRLRFGNLALTLLMTWIGADDTHHAMTFNDFAVAADPLY